MSSVDNRIVRMQFDNAQFERGVMQSMRTLDELNEKLQFKEAEKGISALQVHLSNVDFSGIQNAVQHINHSFTSMTGMVAQRIKEDIVDNVIDAAKRLEQVTLGQIKSGGKARAQNIANAKFMIEGLKFDWEAVKQAADYAVTDTAYGLDAAAKAASQLAASGVDFQETIETVNGQDLTQMHKSLRAISGVAAMTNASYEEISHIFTAVAGMGKLTAMQMNQLSLRGLNIASTIGQEMGKTEAEIRDMVSKGQISFQMFADAMDSAYGEHAKDANKTFQGSFSNLKAALSRIGAIFQQPVIDKTNTFFVSVTKRIKEFQAALNDEKGYRVSEKAIKRLTESAQKSAKAYGLSGKAYEQYVTKIVEQNKALLLKNRDASINSGDVEEYSIARFATHFAEAWESAINFVSKVTESLDLSWFKSIGSFLDGAAVKVTKFFNAASKAIDKVQESVAKASESISDALELDIDDLGLLHRILGNEFGYVEERWKKLDDIYSKAGSKKTGKWLQGYMDQLAAVGYDFKQLGWTEEEFKKKEEELAKTEAQRISEMSKEELLINGIASAINTAKRAMTNVKHTIGTLVKTFGNLLSAAGKVISTFRGFGAGLRIEDLTFRFAEIANSVLRLSEAVRPSEKTLSKLIDTAKNIGTVFDGVTRFITSAVVQLIDFVASCLKADASLEELAKNEALTSLQRSILNAMIVVKNIGRFFSALGKIVIKVLKSIGTAFTNVFGGQAMGGALSALTGGVSLLTDGIATAAEKVAESELPFTILEHIFGAIFMVVQKISDAIGKFTTGIRKFRNGTEDTVKVADKALRQGEKGQTFFEKLGQIAAKGFKWVTDLPAKFKALWEAIKKQEGVQRLKKSLEDLWKSMKDSFSKGIGPMTKGMEEVSRVTGGEGETAFGALADGIGKVSGKIADFLNKLPEYGTKIKTFFENIGKWFDKTIKDLHLDELGEGISGAFSDIFTADDSIFVKVKKFAERIFDEVVKALSNVNWKEVGKGGIMALVAANLFNFFTATSGISEAMKTIKEIPTSILGIFKSLKKLFGTATDALSKATSAYVLANAAKAILAMAAAILLLKDIPKDDLNKALAAVSFMAFIVWALMKAVGSLMYGIGFFKEANAKVIDNSTKNLLQINSTLGRFAGVALLIFSVGGAAWMIAKAVNVIAQSNTYGKGALSAAISSVTKLVITVGIIAAALVIISRINIGPLKGSGTALIGIGVALAGMALAMAAIAGMIAVLSKIDVNQNAIFAVIGIVSSVILMSYVLGTVARWAQPKALLALALDMVVMALAVGIIGAEIVGLAALMAIANVANQGDVIMTAVAAMAITMIAMGASFGLMAAGMSKMKNPAAIVGPLLSMAAVVAVIGWTLKTVAEAAKDNMHGTVIGFFAIVAVIGMIAVTIEKAVSSIRTGDSSTKAFLGLAAVFAAVGVCMALMALAIRSIPDGSGLKVLGVIALLGITAFAISKIAKAAGEAGGSDVADTLIAMAVAFIALGAAMVMFATAANMLTTVNSTALAVLGVTFGILVVVFGVLAALCTNPVFAAGIKTAAESFKLLGMGLMFFGIAALAFGAGVMLLGIGIGKVAEGIGVLAQAFHDHKVTVLVMLVILGLLVATLALLVKLAEPISTVVAGAADAVLSTTKKAGTGLSNLLQNTGKNISTWWKGVQPKTKAMIVTGIATLCAAILKATPQVLQTAKALLGKLVGFLIDIIPDAVKAIVAILIKLINELADTIRSNSAKIAFAIWNLFEALLEVVLEVLGQMILLITGTSGPFGKLGQKLVDGLSMSKGMLRKNLAEMEAYADEADEIANKYKDTALSVDAAAEGDPWAQKAKEMEELKNETNGATDAIEKHTDAMDTYFEAAKKGAKTRIPGIPIEVENVGPDGKFIGGELSSSIQDGLADNPISMDGIIDLDNMDQSFMPDAMQESIENSKSDLYKSTEETVQDGPVAAIEDSEPMIRKSTQEHVMDVIKSVVEDDGNRNQLATRSWKNGEYIAEGTADGVLDNLFRITDAVGKAAKLTNESFVGPLQIESPSKVFYKNGAYILQGLANGMNANENLVTDATTSLSDNIIASFGASMDYVNRLSSGQLQYDPTIRPVLDSSNIGRGAGAINSMFRNQNVSLSGFSGQLAADIGQLDSRNSDVVEELRALREEMGIMGDQISQMQIVMDTGALVGATAGPMDKALGQRAVRFGRG